ncbi:bestrophin family protein [Zunongwangia endophytica]|uniref:Bestrophin family protein n=1 Tax=Zunongwangia endophytica TaxID=1808945 RepID=A0ABV8H4E9_9FLAO|nr:bestrophin family ion channel [Zunongwangia endophytica]MDN3594568.1 bestrophin family ion channel [Zunongwangia endophytica]
MIVARNLKWKQVFFYMWKPMLYFLVLSLVIYILHAKFGMKSLSIPFNAVATLSTALAIYLGFKNNSAYDRWWEARKIWGLLVNYSRAWSREILSLSFTAKNDESQEIINWQKKVIYRHIAFVHSLRVFLRIKHPYNQNKTEIYEGSNQYDDIKDFVSAEEFKSFLDKNNPPNYLIQLQSEDLKYAYRKGWISDYRFVRLDETLTEFNNHQGMSERIKNTPMPRPYSFFSRVFVYLHGTLVPFAFIEDLGWLNVPLSLIINFIFLALDTIGERTEDPFENRMDDTPLTAISLTIETNLKEMIGDKNFPKKQKAIEGVVL